MRAAALAAALALLPAVVLAAPRGGEAPAWRTIARDPGNPAGIAVYGRHLYITDAFTLRVTERTLGGKLIRSWPYGAPLKNKYQSWGAGIAVDKSGVYVADPNHNRVVRFSLTGKRLQVYTDNFNFPRGIAVDRQGNIYVADWQNNRVVKLSVAGSVRATWTPPAAARLGTTTSRPRMGPPTGSIAPSSVAVAPDGTVYVAGICHDPCEQGGHAFAQAFVDRFSSAGSLTGQWEGNSPYGFEPHNRPWLSADALAVDARGNWYLAAIFPMGGLDINAVAAYHRNGRRFHLWPVNENEGSVQGLALDSRGDLFATHSYTANGQGPILKIAGANP